MNVRRTFVVWAMMSILFVGITPGLWAADQQQTSPSLADQLKRARKLFYQAVEEKSQLAPAQRAFEAIRRRDKSYEGLALTYLGALKALEGKHARWPQQKLKRVQQGLELMDEGIRRAPEDAEALFIHGTTCFFLPFFFSRGDDAKRDFERAIEILAARSSSYDATIVRNVLQFLREHVELDSKHRALLERIERQLSAS